MTEFQIPFLYAVGIFDSDLFGKKDGTTPDRNVTYFELEFYSEDTGGISVIDGRSYPLRANTVLFARPGQIRHSHLPIRSHYIRFSAKDPYVLGLLSALPPVFPTTRMEEYLRSVRHLISLQNEEKQTREALLAGEFLLLLSKIYEEAKLVHRLEKEVGSHNSMAVTMAEEYICQHYTEPCLLADIAAYVNFSPIYFHRIFKAATKKTPYAYVTQKRIARAKELLLSGERSLPEIAEACGFSSQSYFNYVFKKETEQTPSAFRMAMQKQYLPSF